MSKLSSSSSGGGQTVASHAASPTVDRFPRERRLAAAPETASELRQRRVAGRCGCGSVAAAVAVGLP